MIPKNTQIICPRKGHLIGTLNTDVPDGSTVYIKNVTFEADQARVAGEPTRCKLCGSVYAFGPRIFTRDGWKPDAPNIEPVTFRG